MPLRAAESRSQLLTTIVNSLPVLIAYIDRDKRLVFANKAYSLWVQRPAEQLVGCHIREVLGEKTYSALLPYIEQALAGRAVEFELDGVAYPSGKRDIKALYLPNLREGEVQGYFVLAEDITQRRLVENALKKYQDDQTAILDSVNAMIWFRDRDGRILRCNRAAAASLRMTVEQMQGRTLHELYPALAAKYHQEDLDVIETGIPRLGDVTVFPNVEGQSVWIQVDKFPYRNEKGEIIGVIVSAVDITPLKQAEIVLRDSERAQRDFVANVSHEFRTPVAAIKGYAETLRDGALNDKKNRAQFVKTIIKHADRLAWLVEELLTLSSLESGASPLKKERVDLASSVEAFISSVVPLSRKKRLKVLAAMEPGLVVECDPRYLTQVYENLFSNALKFTPPGGSVTFSSKAKDGEIRLMIADTGCGIAEKDLPHIFERFYRGSNAKRTKNHTGLGLHLVKKIIELHSGRIWAESEEGRGTTFHVVLPKAR